MSTNQFFYYNRINNVSTILITAKHMKFEHRNNQNENFEFTDNKRPFRSLN